MLQYDFKRVSNDCLQVAPAGGVTLDDSQTRVHAWKAKKVMSLNEVAYDDAISCQQ
jgi:hypothetical protein